MNADQEKFLNYMLERAQKGKENEIKQLLLESFEKQKTLPLNQETFSELRTKLLALVDSKFIEEIVTNMSHFAERLDN